MFVSFLFDIDMNDLKLKSNICMAIPVHVYSSWRENQARAK